MRKSELIINDGEDVTEVWSTDPGEGQASEPDKTDAQKKTDAFESALNDDPEAFLSVSRQKMGGNSPMEFVGRYPADKFDYGQLQVHLQRTFGGGDYRVMLYASGKIRANKLLSIAESLSSTEKQSSNMGEMGTLLNAVLDRMDNNNRQIVELLQNQSTGGQSRTDLLNEMIMMKNMFDSGTSITAPDPIEQLKNIMGLQKELGLGGPSEDKEEGFGSLLEKLTPLITAATNQPQQPQPKPQGKPDMNLIVRQGIKNLLKGAAKNSDPYSYATMVVDNVPENFIRNFIVAPNALEKLTETVPEVANYAEWFIELGENVKDLLGMPNNLNNSNENGSVAESEQTGDTINGESKPT